MTGTTMDESRRSSGLLTSVVGGTGRRLLAAYRLGGRTLVAAPAIVALAVVPELVQHVVEIGLGMFTSPAMFHAHGTDALRMGFGYVKVTGFTLAFLATARFWAVDGSLAATVKLPLRDVGRLLMAITLAVAQSFLFRGLAGRGADGVLAALSLVFQTALSVYMTGAMLSDPRATLRWTLTDGWPRALFMTLLLAAAFAPCQMLHIADHKLAIGAPAPAVWALMMWDGLFVGLFAALVGSAMFVGYAYGPSWRGWDRRLGV